MNAIVFMAPSVNLFLNGTPRRSKRSQAAATSGTVMAMCPKPLPGSLFPDAYPAKLESDSVPWLWVSSSTPEEESQHPRNGMDQEDERKDRRYSDKTELIDDNTRDCTLPSPQGKGARLDG